MPTFLPSFELDYQQCGPNPQISTNGVKFQDASSQTAAGRVVSSQGYKNISKITAEIDLSGVKGNYLNAAFYMVCKPSQPKGPDYCDAGGQNPYCDELDFLETNGNKILQSTMHLNNVQRYEYSFTDEANNACFNWSSMQDDPANGLHSLSKIVNMNEAFTMEIDFDLVNPKMAVTLSQQGNSKVIYDSSAGPGAEGSLSLDMSRLVTSMNEGYWIICSFWKGYSPTGPGSAPWWNGSCNKDKDNLCGGGSFWSLNKISVEAESSI